MNKSLAIVLNAYKHLGQIEKIEPIHMGLINDTFIISTASDKYILQRVSNIFDDQMHLDMQAVLTHLEKKNILAPQIIKTDEHSLNFTYEGHTYRVLQFISGNCYHYIKSKKMAYEAGCALARFHQAMSDFNYSYTCKRKSGGDYDFHIAHLEHALHDHTHHDYFDKIKDQAHTILSDLKKLQQCISPIKRHVHGDPKISNIIFDENDNAKALIDLDTVSNTGWTLELADALRSWCNPHKEDYLNSVFNLDIATMALKGYAKIMGHQWTKHEVNELYIQLKAITLCLCMRYLTDILNESYWAYDKNSFARPADHNYLRTKAMFHLYNDIIKKEQPIKGIIHTYMS